MCYLILSSVLCGSFVFLLGMYMVALEKKKSDSLSWISKTEFFCEDTFQLHTNNTGFEGGHTMQTVYLHNHKQLLPLLNSSVNL